MGFGNLLNLSVTKIDQSFIRWIVSRFDPVTHSLKIREDLTTVVDSEMVGTFCFIQKRLLRRIQTIEKNLQGEFAAWCHKTF